ncbi:MAG TPA: radical SAM protein, partial [Longimicrobium sp.]|nr:radical SAM protein [Longimicrobium sp.]
DPMFASSNHAVLLAHSYFLNHDPKQVVKMKPYPPLATLITASVLRERGHQVRLFDAMLADGVEEFTRLVADQRPAAVGIFEDNFNFLTKMCTVRMREAALTMVRAARAVGARVVLNGSDVSDRPALYLAAGADAIVVGEVEETAAELFDAWRENRDAPLDGIHGLILPAPGGPPEGRRTPPRVRTRELDALPFPAVDLVDVERYRAAWTRAHGRLSWNMVTSRGCPYRCNWCAKPIFGKLYTQRSPATVASELQHLRETVAPDHIWFADDIFGLTAAWIESFAREVTARRARTPFMMQSRADLMTPATVAALREAGAEEVWLGVESGSQRVLNAMDKGTRVEQVRSATRTLKEHGIRSGWFIQLGYLGEGWDDILLTRDLIRDERPDDIGVSVSYPLPGTGFYEIVKRQLGVKRNWTDSGDLSMMFAGTFDTGFYRQVRDLLHAEADGYRDGITPQSSFDLRWDELDAIQAHHRRTVGEEAVGAA